MTEEEIEEEEEKQAVREVPPKTTKTAPVAPRVPAQPLIQRPTIVAKTVEAKTIEGDEEATTPPIQEPTQTVEERPFSDAENEKEKRDWMNKNLLAHAKENKETIKNTIWNNDCGCGI